MQPPASPPTILRVVIAVLAAVCLFPLATPTAVAAAAPADKPVLYLTFDDGPGRDTPAFLDLLGRYDVTATFFVTGAHVSTAPELAAWIVADGHAIANHSWSHPKLTTLSNETIRSQLARTNAVVAAATGVTPTCYRPPYGATNDRVHAQAVAVGLANAEWTTGAGSHRGLWDIDTNDWRLSVANSGWTEGAMLAQLDRASDGDTVLLHDGSTNRARGLAVLTRWLADNHDRFDFRALPGCGGTPHQLVEPVLDPANPEQWHRARIARLYVAYFGRLPDAEGFEYWNRQVTSGASMHDISYSFAVGSEFTRTSVLSDEDFVRLLYRQVLDREPEPDGFAYWLDQLASGIDRGKLMLYFSDGIEFVRRSAPVIAGACDQGDPIEAWRCWGTNQPAYDW